MSKTEQEKLDTANGNSKNEIPAKEQGASVKVTQATDKSPRQKMKTETSVPRKDPTARANILAAFSQQSRTYSHFR